MSNPQTPMQAAYAAYLQNLMCGAREQVIESILAFLQWFENEPEGVSKALCNQEGGEYDSLPGSLKCKFNMDAKAAIQSLIAQVK